MMQGANESLGSAAVITVLTSSHGVIAKRFSIENGAVCIKPAAQIYKGSARSMVVDGPSELAHLLDGLTQNEAISLGRLAEVGTSFPLSPERLRRDGEISRTKQFFRWNTGPAWALLDVDTKGLPDAVLDRVAGRDLAEVLFEVVPELATAPRVVRASSSAGIQMPDGLMRPASGMHIYVLVARGDEIPNLLRSIHNRLWAAGLGYFAISRSGALLDRSLVDETVGSPERLIFEAPPVVLPPLTRQAPAPRVYSDGRPLTRIATADPELIDRLKSEARKSRKATASAQKKRHEGEQVERVASALSVSTVEARRIVRTRQASRILVDDYVLETGKGRSERVGDFLDRVTGPVGLPCPIEGSEYGLTTAYFYPPDARSPVPRIVSFAHGQVTEFNFERFRKLTGLRWIKPE